MNAQTWWYVARASGIVAWLALTASVLAGILVPTRVSGRQRPAWFLDVHRWLGGLTIGLVALHLGALVADSYVEFNLASLAIPFASTWKPFPVALGVIATWLLVLVGATSWAMRHLPRALWRGVHLLSYAAFFLVSLHGTLAGTDAGNPIYFAASMLALGAVVFATVLRIVTRRTLGRSGSPGSSTPAKRSPAPPEPRSLPLARSGVDRAPAACET